jgi:hypothetical protein
MISQKNSSSNKVLFFNDRPTFRKLHSDGVFCYKLPTGIFVNIGEQDYMMFVMLLWVYIHTLRDTQSNITNIIFTWVHNTNTEKIKTIYVGTSDFDFTAENLRILKACLILIKYYVD